MKRPAPTREEMVAYVRNNRTWGRWGADDQVGAVNLITEAKRIAAARLVRSGRTVSMSLPFPTQQAPNNRSPAQHFMKVIDFPPDAGAAVDYYGISYHGPACTHIDSICHVWDGDGMWNGRDPAKEVGWDGLRFGGIQNLRHGIMTRGVLLNVPKFRGEPFVTLENPVHGCELEEIVRSQGVRIEPGDAIVMYCGREEWDKVNPLWGSEVDRAGLHMSCLPFLRETDCSVLIWDMMEQEPNSYGLPWGVHASVFAFGLSLVDNASLGELARACEEEGRYDFMVSIAPLVVEGGTGAPVNPIAAF
jgi:Putative cyclase